MWCKLWEKGVRGRLWRTIRSMYSKMRSRVRVNGAISEEFPIERGTAQGCTFSPLLFNIFVDGLLEAVEDAGFGLPLAGGRVGALMFADDFAGVEDSAARLQQLIDVTATYLQQWGLGANVAKSAVVVYGPGRSSAPRPAGGWTWAGTHIPEMDTYKYLGVQLHGNASWTPHVSMVIAKGKTALAGYMRFLGARHLSKEVRLLVYKQYVRPVLEYASEIWTATETQSKQLEGIQLSAARAILGCFPGAASVAVLAELGLEQLAERRAKAQLRWYGKLRSMQPDRYPAQVLSQHTGPRSWLGALQQAWHRIVGGQEGVGDLVSFFTSHGPAAFSLASRCLHAACHQRQLTEISARVTLAHLPHVGLYSRQLQPYLCGPPSSGSHIKMQCRTGTLPINALLNTRHLASTPRCPCCDSADETFEHVFLACPPYMDIRAAMRDGLGQLAAPAVDALFSQTDERLVVSTLLSDRFWARLGCFEEANRLICNFLASVWTIREAMVS